MVDPHAIAQLQIPVSEMIPVTVSITTVQGTAKPERCTMIDGLTIMPLDNKFQRSLPPTFVYKPLPDALHEVPSRSTVANIPALAHLAPNFHEKKDHWSTIIIIGRDCVWAQEQEQVSSTDHTQPLASKHPSDGS